MRLNKKMLAVTAILAVGILAGCGSSSSTASSTASSAASSTAASSAAASETTGTNAVEPIEVDETIDALQNGDSAYKVHAGITNVSDDSVTLEVYAYDAYEQEEIEALQAGGVLRAHNEQTGELEDVTIDSIEQDEHGGYTINGGIEEGGVDLVLDHDVYRTMTFDDYPIYYKAGELTLPLAGDVTLSDSSADPQAVAVETNGAAAVAEAIQAEPDGWNCNNTTVETQNGEVSSINRIWVP